MSYKQDDPFYDIYSNVTTAQNCGPKSILRRTSNVQQETNIFEPSLSPSACYDSPKSDSHWRTLNSKIENAQSSSLGRYGSSVSNTPHFSEEHGNNDYRGTKFSKNINAELYAKAIAVKSDLGLLAPSQSSSSSALEALRSYDSDFQTSSTPPPYHNEWSSRSFQSEHQQPTSISERFQMQSFNPKHSKKEDFSNELYQQPESTHSSVPKNATKLAAGSIDLISGLSSIEDEDQFLYGDSEGEEKKKQIYDSPPKTNKNSLSSQTLKSVRQDSLKSSVASASMPERKMKDNVHMKSNEAHAIDLKLQPNVWKNPSIWEMTSGDDIYSSIELLQEKPKGSQLFDRHEQNKRQKLDPFTKCVEAYQSIIDRDKISNDSPIASPTDKKLGSFNAKLDKSIKMPVSSDKKFEEIKSLSSNTPKTDHSKNFVPHVIEKNIPLKHSTESSAKFHQAAEMLKAHLTSGDFSFRKVEGSENLPGKFETQNEIFDNATGNKFVPKIQVNFEQGEIFSSKRTVRVKNLSAKSAANQSQLAEDLNKHDDFVHKNINVFDQHQRVIRSKFDDSPKQNIKAFSGSPERDIYSIPSSNKESLGIIDNFMSKYQTSTKPAVSTMKVSKDHRSRSHSKSRSESPKCGKKKTCDINSSDEFSSNSNSSTPHSSDSCSSRYRSPGSKSPIANSRKSRSPRRYSHKSHSPRRGSHTPRQYSRHNFSPRHRSPHSISPHRSSFNVSKYHQSRDKYPGRQFDNYSSPFHGRRSRSPRKHPPHSYSKRFPDRHSKRKSQERNLTHKYSNKISNVRDYKGEINPKNKTPGEKQIMQKKITKPCNEKDFGKEKLASQAHPDHLCEENVLKDTLSKVKCSEITETSPSAVVDNPAPDDKVAELRAFFELIKKRREMFNDVSHLADSKNAVKEKIPQLNSGPQPSTALTQEAATPIPSIEQCNNNNINIVDKSMFFQQPYPYTGSVMTNQTQFPMNYSTYPNVNVLPPDNSPYNLYNAGTAQPRESYYPPPDNIQMQTSRKNLQRIQLQTFNKLVEPRVCSLKEVPVLTNQKLPPVTVDVKPQQKVEFIQPEKNRPNEEKSEPLTQSIKKEPSDKELRYEELHKKILEQQDIIKKKIEGTQKDIKELCIIKEKAEKKMRRSRNTGDKQYLVQITELIEQAQDELKLMFEQAEDIEKDLTAIKVKITCLKEKDIKVESKNLKPSNFQPVKFKILNAENKKLKAESNQTIEKNSNSDVMNEAKEKSTVFGAKIVPVKEEPQPHFSCYDSGSHWCHKCNELFPSIMAMMDHLHSNEHKPHIEVSVKPWLKDLEENKKESSVNTVIHPVKGIQFISPVEGFYCSLCKELLPDKLMSERHLKGHDHTEKYFKFIKENPVFERRYNISKTAGLSQIYKERKKKENEEKYLVSMRRKEKEREADIKVKKMIQRERSQERKVDELEESTMDVSDSPKDHKSSGIKLTLVNEKNKSRDASDAKAKQIVFIGRAPNYKPKLNTKSDLKSRIENLNKRKEDHLRESPQPSEKSPICDSISALDSDLGKEETRAKSSQSMGSSKKFKSEKQEASSTTEKEVTSTSRFSKSKGPKASKATVTTCANISTVLNQYDTGEYPSSESRKESLSNVKEVKSRVVDKAMPKHSDDHSSTKQLVSAPADTSVPLHKIKLPIPLSQSKIPKKSDATSSLKSLRNSAASHLTSQTGHQESTFHYTPSVQTPIEKVKQNVLLTEEEQDFLLLGINKADMAPLVVPRPPPWSLIQSHDQQQPHPAVSIEIFKKNIPPFPPPLQVPPPTLLIANNNNLEINIKPPTDDNYVVTDMEIENENANQENVVSSQSVEAKVTDIKIDQNAPKKNLTSTTIMSTKEQVDKPHSAAMDVLLKNIPVFPPPLHVPPPSLVLKNLSAKSSGNADSEIDIPNFSNVQPEESTEMKPAQIVPSSSFSINEETSLASENSSDNNVMLLNVEPLSIIKDVQINQETSNENNNGSTDMGVDNENDEKNNSSTNMEIENDNLEKTSLLKSVNVETTLFPTTIPSIDKEQSLLVKGEDKCDVELLSSGFDEGVNDKSTVSPICVLQSSSTKETDSQLGESKLPKNEDKCAFAIDDSVEVKPENISLTLNEDCCDSMSMPKVKMEEGYTPVLSGSLKTSELCEISDSSELASVIADVQPIEAKISGENYFEAVPKVIDLCEAELENSFQVENVSSLAVDTISLENQNVDHEKHVISKDCNLTRDADVLLSVDNLNLPLTVKDTNLEMEVVSESTKSPVDLLNFTLPVKEDTECLSVSSNDALPTVGETSTDLENTAYICKVSTHEVKAESPIQLPIEKGDADKGMAMELEHGQGSHLDLTQVIDENPELKSSNIVLEPSEDLLVDSASTLDQRKCIDIMEVTDLEANKNINEDIQSRNVNELTVEKSSLSQEEDCPSKLINKMEESLNDSHSKITGTDYPEIKDLIESSNSLKVSSDSTCFIPQSTGLFTSESDTGEVCIDSEPKILDSESNAESAASFVPCLEKFDIHDSSMSDHSNPPIIEVCEEKFIPEANEKTVDQSEKGNVSSTTDAVTQRKCFEEEFEKNCSQGENIDHKVAVEMDDNALITQKNQASQELINEAEIIEKNTSEEDKNKTLLSLSEVIETDTKIQAQEEHTEVNSDLNLEISEDKASSMETSHVSQLENVKTSQVSNDSDTDEYETDA